MSLKYDVMITNPPYLSISGFSKAIKDYFIEYYPNSKSDMFAMFMEAEFIKDNGFKALVNPDSWMFLTSYEQLRKKIILNEYIVNMIHLGMGEFDAVVQTTTFVIRKSQISTNGTYFRLVDSNNKNEDFITRNFKYNFNISKFKQVPEGIFVYWISEAYVIGFKNGTPIGELYPVKKGMDTGDNKTFLRFWHEVEYNTIDLFYGKKKWIPYDKGGAFKRWYGNNQYILFWENNGEKIKKTKANLRSQHLYFKESITWSALTSSQTSFRFSKFKGSFDSAGSSLFPNEKDMYTQLAFLNTKVVQSYLDIINPTLNYGAGSMSLVPFIKPRKNEDLIQKLAIENINNVKEDWDSFETSWDFARHPLVLAPEKKTISANYIHWINQIMYRFNQLKSNEEQINAIFIETYGLDNDLNEEVQEKEVSISSIDKERDIQSLMSYLIGVLMGRYSLIEDGLIYAGGEFENTRYGDYELDDDGIVPIYSKLGMEDGLTAKIISLIKQIYGNNSYKENIDFIAEGLGKKQNETSEETLNRYLNDDFYNDHLKTYQKRPIYWMFSSGKDNGFKVLIYLHRYTEDTLAKINSNYLLPETTRLRNELNDLESSIKSSDAVSQRRLEKDRDLVNKQYYEAVEYGLVLDHMANRYVKLDLDEGVKVNYEKFQSVEIVNDRVTKVQKNLLVPIK
jgi:hypothetical protein